MSENRLPPEIRHVSRPVIFGLIAFHAALLFLPWIAPYPVTMLCLLGRVAQLGMLGFWAGTGWGTFRWRISIVAKVLAIGMVVDLFSFHESLLLVLSNYLTILAGGVTVGIFSTGILGVITDRNSLRPQFGIAEIATWTAFFAVVFAASATVSSNSVHQWELLHLLMAGFQGAFVGLMCLQLLSKTERIRERLVLVSIGAGILYLFFETGCYHLIDVTLTDSTSSYVIDEDIYLVLFVKIPLIAFTLVTILPLRDLSRAEGDGYE